MPAFVCTSCNRNSWVGDGHAGSTTPCLDCGQTVTIPAHSTTPCYENWTRLQSRADATHTTVFTNGPDRLARHLFALVQHHVPARCQVEDGSYSFTSDSRNPGTGTPFVIAKIVIHEPWVRGALSFLGEDVLIWVRTTGDAQDSSGQNAIRKIWSPAFQSPRSRLPLFVRLDPRNTLSIAPHRGDRFAYFPVQFRPGRTFQDIAQLDEGHLGTISGTITEDLTPLVELIVACTGV